MTLPGVTFISWNIEGLLSKLSSDLFNTIKQYTIISLQETWVTCIDYLHFEKSLPNYSCFVCKAKRSQVGGRSSGGVIVFVKETLSKLVSRVCADFEYGILLIIDKSVFNLDQHCLYVSLYVQPESSPFYEQHIGSALHAFEELYTSQDFIRYHLILNGDLNARTSNHDDFVNFETNIPELNEYAEHFSNDIEIERSNRDTKVNKFGRTLLAFCKTHSCYIVNGRFGNDKGKGEFTFINANGCSTIDYFILSKKLIEYVKNFEVLEHAYSSHLPICLELFIDIESGDTDIEDVNRVEGSSIWYNLNDENCTVYEHKMFESIKNGLFDLFEEKLCDFTTHINEVLSAFENAIGQCSEPFKQSKTKRAMKRQNDWFVNILNQR